MAPAGNIIAAAVVVGTIAGTYALARTLDHIDEAIDAWGDQPHVHPEMKVAALPAGTGRGSGHERGSAAEYGLDRTHSEDRS